MVSPDSENSVQSAVAGAPKKRGRPRKSADSRAVRKPSAAENATDEIGRSGALLPEDSVRVSSAPNRLSDEIRRIRDAKISAETICAGAKIDAARACVEILWEMVFDYLCSAPALDSAEMGTLSSVLQRLVSSRVQLANSDAKFAESAGGACGAISPETLRKIETALKLL